MTAIVAVCENGGIGREGALLFHIREDLQRFRQLTLGKTVVMGRKTLESLPGGRGLPDRRNLVLTRDPSFRAEGAEVCRSVDEVLRSADPDAFVLGGGAVYQALADACDTAYLTHVGRAFDGADTWFPDLSKKPGWSVDEEGPWLEEDGVPFRFVTWRKRG